MYTWSNSDHSQASRIDRFLIAKSFAPSVSTIDVLPCFVRPGTLLTKRLVRAKNALHASKSGDTSLVISLEAQLSNLISREAQGAKIRSRAQWFEKGEKPTRSFFCLEQKRAENNAFLSLFDKNGVENSQSELENILVDFYQSLFTNDCLDMQIQT